MDLLEKECIPRGSALGHWYYRSKYRMLAAHLEGLAVDGVVPSLLDYGCGSGVFLEMLAVDPRFGDWRLSGFDPKAPSAAEAGSHGPRITSAAPSDAVFDAVLLMDVLEHVDDDGALLADALRHCRPGGLLFITVPAFQCLWSAHDVFLGHRRRYTRRGLLGLLDACAGHSGARAHYYYASILPLAAALRWIRRGADGSSSDLRAQGRWANRALGAVLAAEASWAQFNHVAGLTVVATCRKHDR